MADEGLAGRAESIAVDKLSSAVEAAVKEVSSRHGMKIGGNLVFQPGILIGRQLMESVKEIDTAQKLAADVAAHVQRAGVVGNATLSPGVLIQDGRILLGYFPTEQVFEVPSARG